MAQRARLPSLQAWEFARFALVSAHSGPYQRADAVAAGGPASADLVGICSPTGTGTAGGNLGRLGAGQPAAAHGPAERRTSLGGL